MNLAHSRSFGQRYAFVVVGVVFLALMAAAGLRSTPSVMIIPLEEAFGWRRDVTSAGAAIGIFLYGLMGPFAAALMQRFGIKRVLVSALVLMSLSTGASAFMSEPWHFFLTWGVLTGIGSGCVAVVLGAAVVNRWFVKNRGLMMGLLTASTATGMLIFMPGLAAIAQSGGWRPVVITVALVMAALVPIVAIFMRERPEDIGLSAYGTDADTPPPAAKATGNPLTAAFQTLARASTRLDFWLLFATFYICGFTTNGLIGTHLIALCADNGLPEVRAAGLLAMMGIFDLIGTTASGWLTDRFDPRKLLFVYYGLRGLSLMYLPFSDFSFYELSFFAVFYGLDWIATVPPTLRLTNMAFGERDAPIVFGWIVAGHQLGAASAAFMAGVMRSTQGDYVMAFVLAGSTGIAAAVISLMIARERRRAVPQPA